MEIVELPFSSTSLFVNGGLKYHYTFKILLQAFAIRTILILTLIILNLII